MCGYIYMAIAAIFALSFIPWKKMKTMTRKEKEKAGVEALMAFVVLLIPLVIL